jgi:hypothetical protein
MCPFGPRRHLSMRLRQHPRPAFPSMLASPDPKARPHEIRSRSHDKTSVTNAGSDSDLDKGRPAWFVTATCDLKRHFVPEDLYLNYGRRNSEVEKTKRNCTCDPNFLFSD